MKYTIACIVLIATFITTMICYPGIATNYGKSSDSYVRERVFLLSGGEGYCTGVEVRAPSGRLYVLTAAHCKMIMKNNTVLAIDEFETKKTLRAVAMDREHDLLLLERFDDKYIDVADSVKFREKIHTMTHGLAMATYRTDGEILNEKDEYMIAVDDEEDFFDFCMKMKNHDIAVSFMGIMCRFSFRNVMSTAMVMPGSSGGPAVNESGELIGIVSTSEGMFSGLVPLIHIQNFLRDK